MGTHPIFESDFDCLTEMGNLLGGKNKSRVTELDRAVLGLKKQRDELKRAQKRIENEEDQIKLKAKELLANEKKQKALKLLRRKKAMEKRLNQIDANLENIQGMIDQIQVTKEQHAVVQALDKGNSALKELHKIMDPETVQRIMDEMEDEVAIQSEIDDLISKSITSVDESEIEAELAQLLKAEENVSAETVPLPDVPISGVDLPSVPSEEPQKESDSQQPQLLAA